MPRAEIVHEDAILRLGVSRNLIIIGWLDTPSSAQLRAISRATVALVAKHKDGVSVLDIVTSSIMPRFTQELRDEVAQTMRDPRTQGRASAHVVLTPGLAGVTTRAFLSTATLLARSATQHKVFSELRPAATWLAPHLSVGKLLWSVEDVLAAQGEVTRIAAPAPAR